MEFYGGVIIAKWIELKMCCILWGQMKKLFSCKWKSSLCSLISMPEDLIPEKHFYPIIHSTWLWFWNKAYTVCQLLKCVVILHAVSGLYKQTSVRPLRRGKMLLFCTICIWGVYILAIPVYYIVSEYPTYLNVK